MISSEQALVSIALCTYNGENFLVEQLESIVNQSYKNLEIIVVDDCSKDGTLKILKQYESMHPNFKVYQNEKNLGYIKNFEKAISLCNGDFIALADQDDIWSLEKIQMQVSNVGNHILIYHDSEFVDENGKSKGSKISDVRNFYSGNDSDIFLLENCVSGHTVLFRKELKENLQNFNPLVFHDWWIAYIACNISTICFLEQSLVKYRQHSNASTDLLKSKSKGNKKQKAVLGLEKELKILETFYALPFKKSPVFERLISLYRNRMTSFFSLSLAFFLFSNRSTLLYIKKKSFLSKLNLIIKYAWGYKLKKLSA